MEKFKYETNEPTPTMEDLTINAIKKAINENSFPGYIKAGDNIFYVDTVLSENGVPISNIEYSGVFYVIYGMKSNERS